MNNRIFSRLCNLMQGLGFNAGAGEITTAEMRAYAAGLSAVDELIQSAFDNSFIETADEYGLSMLLSLLNMEPGETPQQSREKIIEAMSRGFELLEMNDIQSGVLANGYTLNRESPKYTFSINSQEYSKEAFKALERIIDVDFPSFERLYRSSGYCDFDELDGFGLSWFEIDDARLPFYAWNAVAGNNFD